MSGWEQYVEQAAKAIDPAAYDDRDAFTLDPMAAVFRRDVARERAERMLAVVGPLIAEDTRTRMVAAAGRALEQEEPRYMETLDEAERTGH